MLLGAILAVIAAGVAAAAVLVLHSPSNVSHPSVEFTAPSTPTVQAPPPANTSGLPHFLAPSAAGGRVYQSRGRTVAAFGS